MSRIPIRARLSIFTALIGLAVVVVVGLVVYRHTVHELRAGVDRSLEEELTEIIPIAVDDDRSLSGHRAEIDDHGIELAQVIDAAGRVVDATPGAGDVDLAGVPGLDGTPATVTLDGIDVPLRALRVPVSINGREVTLAVATSAEQTDTTLRDLRRRLATVAALAVVFLGAASYALVGLALRPVERMRSQAAEISAGKPGERLALPRADDELHRLGQTFNDAIEELQAAVDERQAFIASASHELRTPLTNLRAGLELAQRPDRSNEELRTSIDAAAADTTRLIDLTEGLLDLTITRLEQGALDHEQVDVASVVAQAIDDVGNDQVEVTMEETEDLGVVGDREQLRRVVVNLATNALVHGRAPVTVDVADEGDRVQICVTDQGEGIPDDLGPRAYVAFVRAAEAHQRPGAGLGLAIVREIVTGHGGTVEHRHDTSGTHLTVSLPRAAPSSREDAGQPGAGGRSSNSGTRLSDLALKDSIMS